MPIIKIREKQTGNILYAGLFNDLRECLEYAVTRQTDLRGADLSYSNLGNAQLDGALLQDACFDGANLSGANMSEAMLGGAAFRHASLYNTCLCQSVLKNCDFTDAGFGATDIFGSDISYSRFSTLSAFTMVFTGAEAMQGCVYKCADGRTLQIDRPPLCVHGLEFPLIFIGRALLIGGKAVTLDALRPALRRKKMAGRGEDARLTDPHLRAFIKENAGIISALCFSGKSSPVTVAMAANKPSGETRGRLSIIAEK